MEFQPVTFIRKNSSRLANKSFLDLDGKPLCYYTTKVMSDLYNEGHTNRPILYSSKDYYSSLDSFEKLDYIFHKRDKSLDGPVNFNDLMASFLSDKNIKIESEYIVFFCATSPFMKKETIIEMINKIKTGQYDSSFTGIPIRNFCWYEGKTLNYDLNKEIPWTQKLTPVVQEVSSLYIFKNNLFEETGRRIGYKPYIKLIDPIEGHDIDYGHEYVLAKKMMEE